jgi:hypothetical protein
VSQVTARHGLPYIIAGQAQKELTHNEALVLLDALANPSAVDAGANTPPAAPQPGQCWIIGSAPGAEWAGKAHALACWTEGGWRFLLPRAGMRVWIEDQQIWAEGTGAGWRLGDVIGQKLKVGGVQVVGPRLAAVPVPAGGTVQDAEARTAIAALIDRLIGHGLIAS